MNTNNSIYYPFFPGTIRSFPNTSILWTILGILISLAYLFAARIMHWHISFAAVWVAGSVLCSVFFYLSPEIPKNLQFSVLDRLEIGKTIFWAIFLGLLEFAGLIEVLPVSTAAMITAFAMVWAVQLGAPTATLLKKHSKGQ